MSNDLQFPVCGSGTRPIGQQTPHCATWLGSQQPPPSTGTCVAGQAAGHWPFGGTAKPASGPLSQTQVEVTGPVRLEGGDDPAGHWQMNICWSP